MSDDDKKRNDKTANNSNETVSNFVLSQAFNAFAIRQLRALHARR